MLLLPWSRERMLEPVEHWLPFSAKLLCMTGLYLSSLIGLPGQLLEVLICSQQLLACIQELLHCSAVPI